MRRLLLTLLIGFLAMSVGPIGAPVEAAGDGVVRLVFFWSDT